jgi:hypothetical protein
MTQVLSSIHSSLLPTHLSLMSMIIFINLMFQMYLLDDYFGQGGHLLELLSSVELNYSNYFVVLPIIAQYATQFMVIHHER